MSFPPGMLAYGVLSVIFRHRSQNALARPVVIVVVIFCVVTAVVALVGPVLPVLYLIMKEQYQVVVAVQIQQYPGRRRGPNPNNDRSVLLKLLRNRNVRGTQGG